jgi:hypothetical protein
VKDIFFTASDKDSEDLFLPPKPSSLVVPDWYKDMPQYVNNLKKLQVDERGQPLFTVKKCLPFLESLLSGYTVTTPCDIFVSKKEIIPEVNWRLKAPVVSHHISEQTDDLPQILWQDYYKIIFKWIYPYLINTPKNYSILFTHPLNRPDLPFYTLSGIVDTDSFNMATNFPFLIKKDFEGLIPQGTPIVQFIPFKREAWNSKINKTDEEKTRKSFNMYDRSLLNYYRNNFWKKKQWN